jgi:hypothetical protein
MKFRYFQLFFFLFAICAFTKAQTSSSPYTLFGAGQIEQEGSGTNHAMGGTGIALRSSYRTLNNINPASYCGIDSLAFILDIGVFGKYTNFDRGSVRISKYFGNFKYMAMGTRLYKWWGASIGITPYSSVDYEINTTDQIEGGVGIYSRDYNGSGGITKFYFGNAFTPIKNLSLGINIAYLLGTIEQLESVVTSEFSYDIIKTYSVHNLMLDYGLQYKLDKNKWNYTFGVVYGNKRSLQSNTSLKLINTTFSDTIDLDHNDQNFIIPQKIGLGFAAELKNKFRVGVDYERRDWSELKFNNPLLKTRNSNRISMGMEYTPVKSIHDGWLMRCYYRVGLNYTNSYLIIDGEPINSMAMTVGIGMPLKRQLSTINLSFEMGQNGTTKNNLIKETYYLVHVNFSLSDYWFQKPKYD